MPRDIHTAPDALLAQANLPDFDAEYAQCGRSCGVLGRMGNATPGFKPWNTVMEWEYPNHRWFVGGETNITLNALDRHADGPNRNRLALIWIAEDGSEQAHLLRAAAAW
ncbi:MAG: acetyl-coenzyme A synthetase N-terminal domain-containing protein [Caldilineaceae bacterium]